MQLANYLLPMLMDFFSKNLHREYPQKVFETGDIVLVDPKAETRSKDEKRLAGAICAHGAGYEEILSCAESYLLSLGIDFEIIPASHPSFITGRGAMLKSGKTELGLVGEIHPVVLNNWGIENMVSAFELSLEKINSLI